MLLSALEAILLGNILAGKEIVRAGYGRRSLDSYRKEVKLFILIVLVLNMFLKKLKTLSGIKV